MIILPGEPRHALYPIAFILFSPILLFIITIFALPAAAQTTIQVRVPEGTTARASVGIKNKCPKTQTFRGTLNDPYVRFAEPAEAVVVQGGSRREIGLIFSAGNLGQIVHRGSLQLDCITCTEKCVIDRINVPYEMTVIEPPEVTQIAREFRKMLYDEIDKYGAVVDDGAREKLNDVLKAGANALVKSGAQKRREEANKNLKKLAARLIANAEKRKKQGNEFIFFLLAADEMVITDRSVNRTLRGLCPLFPFC